MTTKRISRSKAVNLITNSKSNFFRLVTTNSKGTPTEASYRLAAKQPTGWTTKSDVFRLYNCTTMQFNNLPVQNWKSLHIDGVYYTIR